MSRTEKQLQARPTSRPETLTSSRFASAARTAGEIMLEAQALAQDLRVALHIAERRAEAEILQDRIDRRL